MSETWNISVGGRSYGPYTLQQMQSFHAEGRLAAHSFVARSGEEQFHAADHDPLLASFFAPVKKAAGTPSATGKFLTADGLDGDEETESPTFGRSSDEVRTSERGRYVVIADMKSRSISGLEEEIFNLGPVYALMPQAWLLISDLGINTIRNTLVQKMGKIDMLFIVDATHNKAAWFNFGPESDARIRRVWTAQNDATVAKSARR